MKMVEKGAENARKGPKKREKSRKFKKIPE